MKLTPRVKAHLSTVLAQMKREVTNGKEVTIDPYMASRAYKPFFSCLKHDLDILPSLSRKREFLNEVSAFIDRSVTSGITLLNLVERSKKQ